jgi:LacI family transcriptional regulator, galactose operon repressor
MADRRRQSRTIKKRLDIRDVARHANVSIATVSRTINGVTTVDKELAKRVWKAIEGLNYYPNTQARALVSGRSKIFGLLISEITNPFFPELIQGFENVAVENGYDIMISSTNYDVRRMQVCVRRLLERNVEGVAVMTFGIEAPLLDELASRNVPLVFVDVGPPNPHVSTLTVNYHQGIREGVQHLAALTHRDIAFVSGPLQQLSCQLRKSAFLTSMEEIGITPPPELLLEGDHTLEGGMRAADQLLKLEELPTAVMCSNDMTAIGVLRTFTRAGLRIPQDVSVIGFDDIHLAEFVFPPLTTVNMSRTAIARAAFEALRDDVEDRKTNAKDRSKVIPTRLTVRQSTGFPRGTMVQMTSRSKSSSAVTNGRKATPDAASGAARKSRPERKRS